MAKYDEAQVKELIRTPVSPAMNASNTKPMTNATIHQLLTHKKEVPSTYSSFASKVATAIFPSTRDWLSTPCRRKNMQD
jgi:hypothetical protein